LHAGTEGLVAQRIDRYRRPYEGTANFAAAMQAYLDWEYGSSTNCVATAPPISA